MFAPGHDQKLRSRLERRLGSLLLLAKLVDVAEAHADGRSSPEMLSQQVRTIFESAKPRSHT
jgi:hypothetical protein